MIRRTWAVFAACLLSLDTLAQTGGQVVGTWSGQVKPVGSAMPYGIELRVWQNDRGVLVGEASYPQLNCRTMLSQLERDERGVAFAEQVMGGARCARGGIIFLSRTEAERLGWLWFTPDRTIKGDGSLMPMSPTSPVRSSAAEVVTGRNVVTVRPSQAELEASAARLAKQLDDVLDTPFTAFTSHTEVVSAIATSRKGDPTLHAVSNFAALMPRFIDSEKTFELAASVAAKHQYRAAEVAALNRDYQAAMVLVRQEWVNLVMGVGLQAGWHQILRLAEGSARDPMGPNAARSRRLLEQVPGTGGFRQLMQVSAKHAMLYRAIEDEYRELARRGAPTMTNQLRANDMLVVFEVLGPNDLRGAEAEIARLAKWRADYVASVNRDAMLNVLGALFGGGVRSRDADSSFDDMRRQREEDRARNDAREREREQLDRESSRSLEPSPLLPPPRTIN